MRCEPGAVIGFGALQTKRQPVSDENLAPMEGLRTGRGHFEKIVWKRLVRKPCNFLKSCKKSVKSSISRILVSCVDKKDAPNCKPASLAQCG